MGHKLAKTDAVSILHVAESADGNRNFLKLQELHDYEDNYRRQMYTKYVQPRRNIHL